MTITQRVVRPVRLVVLLSAMLLTGATASAGEEQAPVLRPQETCPVMGGKINKKLYVDADGKRIYVCCGGCTGQVRKDPAAALKTLEKRGEQAEDLPPEASKSQATANGKSVTQPHAGHGHAGHKRH